MNPHITSAVPATSFVADDGEREERFAEQAQGESATIAQAEREKIAIIGMSGRYPDADTLDAYWANLAAGRDSVGEIPPTRWNVDAFFDANIPSAGKTYSKWLGGLRDIDCFDPLFFNITPKDAALMDPQQRLFLEEGYRAFEDAGYDPVSLSASRCGVYLGISGSEYGMLLQQHTGKIDFIGSSPAISAARIAYFLNLKGPAIPVDTACSSSLVAIHLACQALRHGEVDMALAGGAALYLMPEMYVCMSEAGALSPGGKCRVLDNEADGFVPGEGVGAVVLKRLTDAERDGDIIHGVIIGSGLNQDGKSNGLTAPNEESQAALSREVYRRNGIHPESISYVELHGTGTKLGDPIELNALTTVFAEQTAVRGGCGLGAVKSNIGHTSAASGVAGLQKVLLQMRHRELVPSLHYHSLNEHVDVKLAQSPFFVCTRHQPWIAAENTLRRAAVSSFGISGTNAHLVVEEYRHPCGDRSAGKLDAEHPLLIVLSAKRRAQLKSRAAQLQAFIQQNEHLDWPALAYTLQTGRAALEHRLAFIATSREQLMASLGAVVEEREPEGLLRGDVRETSLATRIDAGPEQNGARSLLEIGRRWVLGEAVDWNALYREARPGRLSLPTYPFARERYWMQKNDADVGEEPGRLHPFIHRNSSQLSAQRFSTTLTGREYFFAAHQVAGEPLMPAAVQLEWARAAVALAHGLPAGHHVVLEDITWLRPLAAPKAALDVHISIRKNADGGVSFTLYSESKAPGETEVFSQGRAFLATASHDEMPTVDIHALQAACTEKRDGGRCYARFASLGLHYGHEFNVLKNVAIGRDMLVAELHSSTHFAGMGLPPALIDGALHAGIALRDEATLVVPFALERVEQWGEVPNDVWAILRRTAESREASERIDVDLVNRQGHVVVRLSGFSSLPLSDAQKAHRHDIVRLDTQPAKRVETTMRLTPESSLAASPESSVMTENNMLRQIEDAVTALLASHFNIAQEDLDRDKSFGSFGIDSIASASCAYQLNARYGLRVKTVNIFEFSTIAKLTGYLARQFRPEWAEHFAGAPAESGVMTEAPDHAPVARQATTCASPSAAPEPIAIIGMSGCFPQAENIDELWANLLAGRDCIGELPSDRLGKPLQIPHAGILKGVDEFDSAFFNISRREAECMDPQHRLLMMHVYSTLEDAGYSVQSLAGSNTALLIGLVTSGYAQLLSQSGEPVSAASLLGTSISMGPSRMSYWLDWHGPCESIDTACSSSLVAVHHAVGLLRSGQCDQAVVGGVNTLLSWDLHEGLTQAGMLSPDGRCRTFSAQANGFVRGEGVAMLMLKRLSAAENDGDTIYGVILGSSQNHGGQANSLTSPNPQAQAKLIEAAFRDAAVEPGSVGYIETHGTGTTLGDPIEIQGLKQAFQALSGGDALPERSIGVGSIKSNIGHLEPAAGVAGLIKALLQIRHGYLTPSLHSQPLNPHIDLSQSPFYIVDAKRPWAPVVNAHGERQPRRAGVSSFGLGGVNAHVVLGEYIPLSPSPHAVAVTMPVLITLSARDDVGLKHRVTQLAAYLDQHDVELTSLAYTLQVGREPMKMRLAFVVSSVDELRMRLLNCLQQEGEQGGVFRGEIGRGKSISALLPNEDMSQEIINLLIANRQLESLAQWWVMGLAIDWPRLYGDLRPRRIRLPAYPFAKERFWVKETQASHSSLLSSKPPTQRDPEPGLPRATEPEVHARIESVAQIESKRAELERFLRETLASSLRIDAETVTSDRPLSEMGLDSVIAVEWIRGINRQYSIVLSTNKVYEFPTIRQMAQLIEQTCKAPQETAAASHERQARAEPGEHALVDRVLPAAAAPPSQNASPSRLVELERELTQSLAASLRIDSRNIAPDAPLSEIGLDSIIAVEWVRDINRQYAILLSTSKIYDFPTIRQLARVIQQHQDESGSARSGSPENSETEPMETAGRAPRTQPPYQHNVNAPTAVEPYVFADQLKLEKLIDLSGLNKARPPVEAGHQPARHILLTGANGFVGKFIAQALIDGLKRVDGTLYCLVRAPSNEAAWDRLLNSVAASPELMHRLVELEQGNRLVVLAGDLSKSQFGLDDPTWSMLAHNVGTILHNGAQVNHILSYQQLYATNVQGTAEVIRLALTGARKSINFISSVGVGLYGTSPVKETDTALDLYDHCIGSGRYAAGYIASKWAGEVLLLEANQQWAVPVNVFRCGMALPHSDRCGFVNLEDVVSRFLISAVQTGIYSPSFFADAFAERTAVLRGLPVDRAARAIATISLSPENGYSIYHVLSHRNNAPSLGELVEWVRQQGYPILTMPNKDDWGLAFMRHLQALEDRVRLHSLSPCIAELDDLKDIIIQPEFDNQAFHARLCAQLGDEAANQLVSPVDRHFIAHYLSELANIGLLTKPH